MSVLAPSAFQTHPSHPWTGVVLASGQSSRMGEDKALLLWEGKPLYQHMGGKLAQAGAEQVLINRGDVAACREYGRVTDRIPGRGPLSGVHAALSVCKCAGLLVVPVDMPLLRPEHIAHLARHFDGAHPVQYQGYSLPLVLPVDKACVQAVDKAIHSDNRRHYALWRLFETLGGVTLPPPEDHAECFSNTNTPEEWQTCQAASVTGQ
ncbi:molybdenum cofactor guanylyltransferase [Sansalvadorimonas verongulae]|uniref:molybdenum cofactor guanylyltransferase n=1 Tax=Sansalvadorimonas verongulae TaxID=2172824 RepID=UPI0012BBAAB8|nr:molybdenum cofactor guanylyltransferase [Sansalvadorimonas verongulae]MTI12776.1 molybdenum cofactor guanylyltransferase [Sansalvadorimonas verongulae]